MKFEKLNENKIRIILTIQDLNEKHIDFHSFMFNTIESQDILLDMLEEAKKETGFDPEDFNLKIEALAMADTNFIFTITKISPDHEKDNALKKKFTITVNEVMAESIILADNDTEILLGESKALECEFTPENTTDKTVVWTTSDNSVISVSEGGEITANKLGTATITATHKELTDSIDIEVKPIDAESIEIILPDDTETNDEGQPKVNKGSEIQLKSDILPVNTTYKEIEWSVSDETIATIDKNGVLTANATGTITVTATAKSGVAEEIEIEIYSNAEDTAAGILGLAVIGGSGAAWYYRRKKKKETEAEWNLDYEHHHLKSLSKQEQPGELNEQLKRLLSPAMVKKVWVG